jgi:hypothetical protein
MAGDGGELGLALGGFAGGSGHEEEFTVFSFELPVEEKRVISDQISAIRRQEEAYTEVTEGAEFAENRDGGVRSQEPTVHPEKASGWGRDRRRREGWGTLKHLDEWRKLRENPGA